MTETTNLSVARRDSGVLAERADIDDKIFLAALGTRLDALGDRRCADEVLQAARSGDAKALSIMATIAIPAPVSRLNMPLQQLTRRRREGFGTVFGRLLSPLR